MYKFSIYCKHEKKVGAESNNVVEALEFLNAIGERFKISVESVRAKLTRYGYVDINDDFAFYSNNLRRLTVVVGNHDNDETTTVCKTRDVKKIMCGFGFRRFSKKILRGTDKDYFIISTPGKVVYRNYSCGVVISETDDPQKLEMNVAPAGLHIFIPRIARVSSTLVGGRVYIKLDAIDKMPHRLPEDSEMVSIKFAGKW